MRRIPPVLLLPAVLGLLFLVLPLFGLLVRTPWTSVPRLLAALIVFPLLTVLADVLGVLGGMVIMFLERGADMYAYWNVTTYWVTPRDFLTGIFKSFFFGGIITLIGCYNGLSTEGGTEGLGRATTATVVHVTMAVIVSDFFLTKLFLMVFW